MLFHTLHALSLLGNGRNNFGQAAVRWTYTIFATLGGLVIMRQGGPVQIMAVNRRWGGAVHNPNFGLLVGIPLATINAYALQFMERQSISWQSPLAASLDALQPGIVEEVIYRFALWGLLWQFLKKSLPNQAIWLSAILAMLIHSYAHFDALFIQSPLIAFGMGLIMASSGVCPWRRSVGIVALSRQSPSTGFRISPAF